MYISTHTQVHTQRKGFSLVEALVSIGIITVAISAATSLVQTSLQSAYVAKARVVTLGLANEGVEYARSLRDNSNTSTASYTAFIDSCTAIKGGCQMDIENGSIVFEMCSRVPNGICGGLSADADNQTDPHAYTTDPNNPPVNRIVTTYPIEDAGETIGVRVVSKVTTKVRGRDDETVLESVLLDIYSYNE